MKRMVARAGQVLVVAVGILSIGGAVRANVEVLLANFYNNATMRDLYSPQELVTDFLGASVKAEYVGVQPEGVTPRCHGAGVLGTVLSRVYKQNGAIALTPDVVLYLIGSRVAEHVAETGDVYRGLFTTKQSGTETIIIEESSLQHGKEGNDWSPVLLKFYSELQNRLKTSGLADIFAHNFSTSTDYDRACGAAVLMGAAKNFIKPEVFPRGMSFNEPSIAAIKLKGIQADWQSLVKRVKTLATKIPTMQPYFGEVLGVLSQFVATFDNQQQTKQFWSNMYRKENGQIAGWMRTLLGSTGNEMTAVDFSWGAGGPQMKFVCGVLSFTTDDDGYLEPTLGYAVPGPTS